MRRTSSAVALLGSTLLACAGGARASSPPPATRPATPPAGRVDSFRVPMPELGGRERTVRVRLPAGYATGARAYPVLYLQDAQQLFAPGWFGDWRVDETLDRLEGDGRFAGLIVVGVDNGERRWDEYGPWANDRMRDWIDSSWARPSEGGQGSAYVAFLANTLKPRIDRDYRTLPGREHTGVGGSSMGGLVALHAGLTRPDVFSKVMAMSSAVWFAEGGGPWLSRNRLVDAIRAGPVPGDVRFYLDVGTAERSRATDPAVTDARGEAVSYPRAYLEGSRAVAEALRAGGVPAGNLRFVVDSGAPHNESAWSRRLESALLWLYR